MYVQMVEYLPADLSGLHVGLVDERFGPYGHPDSNEHQLYIAGVIPELESRGAVFQGILITDQDVADQNVRLEQVALAADAAYTQLFATAQYVIALIGMGADGHSAGWLPTRTEQDFKQLYTGEAGRFVIGYDAADTSSDNQHRQRLTISLRSVSSVDAAFLYMAGDEKRQVLETAIAESLGWSQAPVLVWDQTETTALVTESAT